MEQLAISEEAYEALVKSIFPIILRKGMKATTMDSVAAQLSMSKRTLYEIFESKKGMLVAVISYFHRQFHNRAVEIFNEAGSVIEAIYRILQMHQQVMQQGHPDFFRDMDENYKSLRHIYDEEQKNWNNDIVTILRMGMKQGVFRKDVNYPVTIRLTRLQMESLKRMEEFFPSDITMAEAFDAISVGFLRTIATAEGIAILDRMRAEEPPGKLRVSCLEEGEE